MEHAKLIFSTTLVTLVILFVLQNMAVVEIDFLFWTFAVSRALILFAVLLTGIAIGWLGCFQFAKRKREKQASMNISNP